ncbi:AAA family ATPase [Pseudonocardia humida]|uniref:ATP-binding protein n=1 Tax=Pseudonocardia humida TaxID=2800819 RepID=A0ABT1ACM5_9PSEU|nr:ATP-binding protein [Pseudonocardia humida]MCO1660811.1 ATP-binding protein [Pseudonocardia humida]
MTDRLVGRGYELALLRDAARGGRGRLVLVGGEPGVGRTRLVRELAVEAVAAGSEVAEAACWAGSGAPAYWPWAQLVRAIAARLDGSTLLAAAGTGAVDLTRLVPGLGARLDPGVVPPLAPDQSPFRLFDAVATFVVAVSTSVLRGHYCLSSTTCTGPTRRRSLCCMPCPLGCRWCRSWWWRCSAMTRFIPRIPSLPCAAADERPRPAHPHRAAAGRGRRAGRGDDWPAH